MRRIRVALAIVGSLTAMPTWVRASQSFAVTCSYWNAVTRDLQQSDKCIVTYSEDAKGRFSETYQIKGRVVAAIIHLKSQGQWAAISFNGKPGMRFEKNRETYEFSPSDLSETLSVNSPD